VSSPKTRLAHAFAATVRIWSPRVSTAISACLSQPLEVGRIEARLEEQLLEQRERRGEVLVEHGERHDELVAAGARAHVRAEPVEPIDELGRRRAARALLEQRRRQRREAGRLARLVQPPARQRDRERRDRQVARARSARGQAAEIGVPQRRQAQLGPRTGRRLRQGRGAGSEGSKRAAARRARACPRGPPRARPRDGRRVAAHDVAHVVGFEREQLLERARAETRIAVQHRELGERRRLAADGLEVPDVVGLGARLHACEVLGLDAVARQRGDALAYDVLELRELDARRGRDRDDELPGDLGALAAGADRNARAGGRRSARDRAAPTCSARAPSPPAPAPRRRA
jgi:hypothetical protein